MPKQASNLKFKVFEKIQQDKETSYFGSKFYICCFGFFNGLANIV